ncbi:MAG: YMGG-like glycine zipper-containing protein [Candidatus Omnitrophica bacterium]|nr:YMGG-like glycine zipper-containing protein [Candidatus Omnitrophota bacterium]
MKNLFIFSIIFLFFLSLAGCASGKSRAVEGAVIGGLVGATAGGIVGHQSHHGLEGAGIGAAAGALTGALVGSQIPAQSSPTPQQTQDINPNQITIQNIIEMTKQGINDAVIIDRIQLTNSRFNLTPQDIQNLKNQGVSDTVIAAMQAK